MTKKRTRFLCKILIVFALMFSTFTYTHVAPVIEVEAGIGDSLVIPIPKVVTWDYPTQNAPATRYYEEYTSGKWYSGTLELSSVVRSGDIWKATYIGFIVPK